MKLFLFLLAGTLSAASLVIDCGSETDQYFSTGSVAYKNTGVLIGDATLRISACSPNCFLGASFNYKIPVADGVPYVLKLTFIEPSVSGPLRRFNVVLNEQPFYTFQVSPQGQLTPFSRSTIVMGVDGILTIRFDSLVRSAIIASIELTPLFELYGKAAGFELVQVKCSRCHGNDIVPGIGPGGLDLRTRASILQGGSRGPAMVPGSPDQSLIYQFAMRPQFPTATEAETIALTTTSDDTLGMPPFHPLTDDQRSLLRQWILAGGYTLQPR